MSPPTAVKPFQFYTRLALKEATGLRALTIPQLLKYLRVVPESVIYYHTHHFLQQHQYLTPEPPNDFAYWVTEVLGDKILGEQLSSINIMEFPTLQVLREQLIQTIERYLGDRGHFYLRSADPEEGFHFVKAISIVIATPYSAQDLEEFAKGLEAVTIDGLYLHMFEARLRLGKGSNDFSIWLEESGETALARAISFLDPYTHTMEELRRTILRMVRQRLHVLQEV